jgi:FG-GAP-like repeat/FG-GAP repeat
MFRPDKRVTHAMGRRFEGWSGRRGARGCATLLVLVVLTAPACRGGAPSGAATTTSTHNSPPSVAGRRSNVTGSASSALSFAPHRSYAIGNDANDRGAYTHSPQSVAIGDLNGDGKPDLATTNFGVNTVSVLLNRGDGSFQAEVEYPTGLAPYSVAIGDLNGDGNPDLATANVKANTVSVLLNRGDGSFQRRRDYATGRLPYSVAIGDLNGDGKPDLATANLADTVSVLLNRGDGGFQRRRDYATRASGIERVQELHCDAPCLPARRRAIRRERPHVRHPGHRLQAQQPALSS